MFTRLLDQFNAELSALNAMEAQAEIDGDMAPGENVDLDAQREATLTASLLLIRVLLMERTELLTLLTTGGRK